MEDTGRIRRPLDWRAREIVFASRSEAAVRAELDLYVRVDRAHLVMMTEAGIVPTATARRLFAAIDELVALDFAPLMERAAPRGLYLLYEHYLIEVLGEQVGGAIHIGRSRNDINATLLRLRLRGSWHRLVREGLRLLAVLIRRAERYGALTMPVYTHHQAALPITYGHYLSGVAVCIERDLQGIVGAAAEMGRCPLGAGAAGGTTIPLDTARTARLLGFSEGVVHSVDAVASRDLVLRVLGAGVVLGVTLSRLAADLLLWSTAEFDLVRFPDPLVGSSSMMPQKRNAFLLEHVQARAGAPLGAFTAAAMAMHATPFTNSVAVGTEAVKPLWNALRELSEAATLARLAVAGAEPQPEIMRRRAVDGFTSATELANRLVVEGGLSFRRAHHRVGEAVSRASGRGEPLENAAAALFLEHGIALDPAWLDPSAIAAGAVYGAGPGGASHRHIVSALRLRWSGAARRLTDEVRRWRGGDEALMAAIASVRRGGPPGDAEPHVGGRLAETVAGASSGVGSEEPGGSAVRQP